MVLRENLREYILLYLIASAGSVGGSWFQIPNEDQLVFLSSHAQSFPESKLILCVFSVHSEILRVVDSLQLTATKKVATPANWQVILSLLYYKI